MFPNRRPRTFNFLFGSLLCISISCGISQSTHYQVARIGVLVDLHEPSLRVGNPDLKAACGLLNIHSFQQLEAVRWAVDIINSKSWPGEFELDILVHDTCGESGIAVLETHKILNWSIEHPESPLIGVIVIGSRNNERIIDLPLEILNNANISAVVTSASAAGLVLSKHQNVFTTAPDISSVAEGIVALINQLGTTNATVISTCSHALKRFQLIASAKAIKVETSLILQKDTPKHLDAIIQFLRNEAANTQTVVLILESTELEVLINDGDARMVDDFRQLIHEKSWILGSVGMDHELVKDWSSKFNSNLLVIEPHASINAEFQTYFVNILSESLAYKSNSEAIEFIEGMYHCEAFIRPQKKRSKSLLAPCKDLSSSDLMKKLHPESDIGFIVNAVSVYSAALRMVQLEFCGKEKTCNQSILSREVIESLKKLNMPVQEVNLAVDPTESTVSTSHELEGARGRINYYGKVVSRKYDISISKVNGKVVQIGQYSKEDGLVLDVMVGINLEGGTIMQDGNGIVKSSENRSTRTKSKISKRRGKTAKNSRESPETLQQHEIEASVNARMMMSPPELYISRIWAMVAIAVAITGVFISLYMLVYVLQRMCDGTLHGNQVLGILLLLGIIMMYASVVLFVLPPGTILCNLRVFLPSIATTICFGILLLKAMQLRSLVSLGLGGRVSSLNQFITLVFIVAVQLGINLEWFFGPHPQENIQYTEGVLIRGLLIQECFYSHQHYLYLHAYLGILILVVFLYGTSVIKIRRNYNEAKWITLASCLSLPIVVSWAITVHVGPSHFQEPSACITFLSIATVLLFSIFIPKLSTISQQSSLAKKKQMLKSTGPGYSGSISTIFTNLSDRGTLQSHLSQKGNSSYPYQHHQQTMNHHHSSSNHSSNNPYIIPTSTMPSSNGKSVTYSPRLTTNFYRSSSTSTSLARSGSMKTPFFDSNRAAYP